MLGDIYAGGIQVLLEIRVIELMNLSVSGGKL